MSNRKSIYVVGGSKGGVGKSMVAMAIIDYLHQRQEPVLLLESDTSNPDVWKAYRDTVASELVGLDEADGWVRFVNACEERPDHTVVLNTAARNNQGVAAYGGHPQRLARRATASSRHALGHQPPARQPRAPEALHDCHAGHGRPRRSQRFLR